MAGAAVRIDHEARDVAQQCWRIEQHGKRAGDVGGTDVPPDMPAKLVLGQTEVAEVLRHPPPGMVA